MDFILFFLFLFSYSFACVFLDVDVFNKGFQESEQILNTHFLLHFGFSSVLGKRVREKTGEEEEDRVRIEDRPWFYLGLFFNEVVFPRTILVLGDLGISRLFFSREPSLVFGKIRI